jgi:hypothetical protein
MSNLVTETTMATVTERIVVGATAVTVGAGAMIAAVVVPNTVTIGA